MNNTSDFVIENGVLKEYKGQDSDVIIPEGVTKIRRDAFVESEANIKSISIPRGVMAIGADTFASVPELASVTLPEGLETIGANAFNGCENLTSIAMPASLKSIGRHAFRKCSNLTSLHISDIAAWCAVSIKDEYAHPLYECAYGVPEVYSYDDIFNRQSKRGSLYCKGEPVRHLDIPEGVTQIGAYSFCNCCNIESVHIPKSVRQIKKGALSGIKTVLIDDLQTWCTMEFDANPLADADELICAGEPAHELRIPNGVSEIGKAAFSNYKGLKSVTIPEGVTSIGDRAFERCFHLTSVILPDGLKNIRRYAFMRCDSLDSIVIPDSVTEIGNWAFERCKGLRSVTIPDNVTVDSGPPPFEGCKFEVTVRHWSPLVTKALAGSEITAIHVEDFSTVPSIYRVRAAFGFSLEENKDLDSPRAAAHMAYIKKNSRKLCDLIFTSKPALYFLCEHDLIGAKDIDAYLEEAQRLGSAELKALLLNYQNKIGRRSTGSGSL